MVNENGTKLPGTVIHEDREPSYLKSFVNFCILYVYSNILL